MNFDINVILFDIFVLYHIITKAEQNLEKFYSLALAILKMFKFYTKLHTLRKKLHGTRKKAREYHKHLNVRDSNTDI